MRSLVLLLGVSLVAFACSNEGVGTGMSDAKRTSTGTSHSGGAERSVASAPPAQVFTSAGGAATLDEGEAIKLQSATSQSVNQDTAGSPNAVVMPTMLIRTGQASIEVKSVDTAIVQVRALAHRLGGYVANTSMEGGQYAVRSATLEVKLPAARFDEAVPGLRPIGTVESVNVTSEDVGEEYVDVSARMANARRLEQRLIDLLTNRAGKLEDVLAVERELARVREQIERYEGRMRYLRTRAAISTLTVTVHEGAPILSTTIGENPIIEAFKNAWRNFVGFVAAFIALLGVIIPVAVLGVGAWVVYRKLRRKTQ